MSFRPRCPKCSYALWFEPSSYGHPEAGCNFCGTRIMGEKRIHDLIESSDFVDAQDAALDESADDLEMIEEEDEEEGEEEGAAAAAASAVVGGAGARRSTRGGGGRGSS